jgi:hypothetical protein
VVAGDLALDEATAVAVLVEAKKALETVELERRITRRRYLAEHQPAAGQPSARGVWSRGEPNGRCHRQSIGEDDGKRRAARL